MIYCRKRLEVKDVIDIDQSSLGEFATTAVLGSGNDVFVLK